MESKKEVKKEANKSWGAGEKPEVTQSDVDAATRANIINQCSFAIKNGRSLRSATPLGPAEKADLQNHLYLAGPHAFWDEQPIRQVWQTTFPEKDMPYHKSRDVTKISKTPIGLPAGYEWVEVDVKDDKQALNLCLFLQSNCEKQIDPISP